MAKARLRTEIIMGRVEDIIELSSDRELNMTARVALCAEAKHLETVAGLSDDIQLVELMLAEDPPEAIANVSQIMILQVDPALPMSIARIERLKNQYPYMHIVAGLPDVDMRTTRKMIRLGIEDVVRIPFDNDEVMTCVLDVATRIDASKVDVALAPVVAVMKSVGGCGASTVATHLAGAFARHLHEEMSVCVIDLDLQMGNVAPFLGARPRLTLQDLIEADSRLDDELLNSVIVHSDSGVDVISAPADIIPIEGIDATKLGHILTLVRQNYDMVVLDLPADLTNWALATVVEADLTIVLAQLDLASLNQTKRRLRLLASMGYEKQSIEVVLNKTGRKMFGSIDTDDAERALGHDITFKLGRETELLSDAQSQGMLVWDVNARGKLGKEFAALASHIAEKVLPDE